jgi:hypothetical protein
MVIARLLSLSTVPDIGSGVTGFKFTLFASPARSGAFPVPKAGFEARDVFDSEAGGTATLVEIVAELSAGSINHCYTDRREESRSETCT